MTAAPRIPLSWVAALSMCASAAGAAGSTVLARFDGGEITAAELDAAALNQPRHRRAALRTADGRQALLQDLITYELLVREAGRRGYARDRAVRNARRSASIEAMLEARRAAAPERTPEQVRATLLAELRALHPPRVHSEQIDAVVLDTIGVSDQPQGFRPAPNDPRLAPRRVEPDGM